jgi:arabinofuranosyltransferase
MNSILDFTNRKDGRIVLLLLVVVFSLVVIKNAWVGDDAYITFRTVENFLSGHGLTYNPIERVQTYTHPLWMFLISGVYFLTNRLLGIDFWAQLYYTVVAISILVSIAAVLVLVYGVGRSMLSSVLAITILILSKAYIDYSTSGLENPLSHLILAAFLWIYFRSNGVSLKKLFLLSLLAALAALNRPDTLLLYLPALGFAWWQVRDKWRGLLRVMLGFLPLILWELFSLFYYGSLSPNTAYAKLSTGIGLGMLVKQGYFYFLNSISLDPLTLTVIAFVILLPFVVKEWRFLPLTGGILLYLVYITGIGGDFMSGRYFAAPLLMAACILAVYPFRDLKAFGLLLLVVLLVGLNSPRPPIAITETFQEISAAAQGPKDLIDEKGISDEHLFYQSRLGLMLDSPEQRYPGSTFAGKRWKTGKKPTSVETTGPLGIFGYVKGPDVHVIDSNGLADPLISRLPVQDPTHWRIGHFKHIVPDGYMETLPNGENKIADPNLARYYDKIRLITRGALLDPERLATVLRFNLGYYDPLLQAYIKNLPEK